MDSVIELEKYFVGKLLRMGLKKQMSPIATHRKSTIARRIVLEKRKFVAGRGSPAHGAKYRK